MLLCTTSNDNINCGWLKIKPKHTTNMKCIQLQAHRETFTKEGDLTQPLWATLQLPLI